MSTANRKRNEYSKTDSKRTPHAKQRSRARRAARNLKHRSR